MTKLTLWTLLMATLGPTVFAGQKESSAFRLVDTWGSHGRVLVTSRPLFCAKRPAQPLKAQPEYEETQPQYTWIQVGDGAPAARATVVLARARRGRARVYVDSDRDGSVTEQEAALLTDDAVSLPACRGKRAGLITIPMQMSAGGQTKPISRTGAVWLAGLPNIVFFAYRGFLQGKVQVGGSTRAAFVVDGNANGVFHDENADQLWIDLDGNGKLDMFTEQFPVRSLLRIHGQVYSLAAHPDWAQIQFRPVEGGLGKAKVTYASKAEGKAVAISMTLVSRAGDVVAARSIGKEFELPSGEYRVSSLTLQLADAANETWTYSFANWSMPKGKAAYPIRVEKDKTVQIVPFRAMTLNAKIEGDCSPGETMKVSLAARTEAGLQLTSMARGSDAPFSYEDYAQVELVSPDGGTVATTSTGFS